ncbi:unnamed protein product, partial [Ectocarpus sp. 13 AM-2016]
MPPVVIAVAVEVAMEEKSVTVGVTGHRRRHWPWRLRRRWQQRHQQLWWFCRQYSHQQRCGGGVVPRGAPVAAPTSPPSATPGAAPVAMPVAPPGPLVQATPR